MAHDVFPPTDFAEPGSPGSEDTVGSDDTDAPGDETKGLRAFFLGRWNSLWYLVLVIGFILFELTAQPALVAVAICSKFGLEDVRNGYWLRRSDPLRVRGKVLFWFSLSRGLWKTTLVAFVAMVGFVFLAMIFGQRQLVARGHIVGSGATFLFGFILASLTTLTGVILARVGAIKIWLDAGVSEARAAREFPPRERGINRVSLILAAALILPVMMFLILMVGVAQANPAAIRNAIGFLLGLFVLPVVIIGTGAALSKSVVARYWAECWSRQPSARRGRTLREVAIEEGALDEQAGHV